MREEMKKEEKEKKKIFKSKWREGNERGDE